MNGSTLGLGLLTSVMVARGLGPEGRGTLAAAMLWPGLLTYAISLGVGPAALYHAAQPDSNPRDTFNTAARLALVQSALGMAAGLLLLPRVLHEPGAEMLSVSRIYLFVIPFSLLTQYACFVLQAMLRFQALNLVRLLIPTGYLAGASILWMVGSLSVRSVIVLHLALNVASLVAAIGSLAREGIRIRIGEGSRAIAQRLLGYGLRAHIGTVSQLLNLRLDQALIAALLPIEQLGLYASAVSAASVGQIVSTAIRMIGTARIARTPPAQRVETLGLYFRMSLIVSAVVCALLASAMPVLLPVVFGHEFAGATPVAIILVGGSFFYGAQDVLAGGAHACGEPWVVSRAAIVGLFVTIPLLMLLLPVFGVVGAALASLCAYAVQTVLIAVSLHRTMDQPLIAQLVPGRRDAQRVLELLRDVAGWSPGTR